MRKLLLGVFMMITVAVMGQEQEKKIEGYVINGVLEGNYKADKVYLLEEEYIQGPSRIVDSAQVVNNRYTFKGGNVEYPKLCYIKSADPKCLSPLTPFFLENGEIDIRANAEFFLNARLRGTVNNEIFNYCNAQIRSMTDSMQMAFAIERRIYGERDHETEDKAFKARSAHMTKRNFEIPKTIAATYTDQVVAPFLAYWALRYKLPLAELKELRAKFAPSLNEHPYMKQLDEFIRLAEFNVGSTIPDFTLPTPDGKKINIRDFRGKYVLIDFWASWCGPCLREMPNVVKLYKECKGKNFEILGISLDSKKDAWVAAIKKNNMKWPQVSDLLGWYAEAAKLCNVHAIPYTILIDPEGKVIALELRGEALIAKVKEVLGKK